MEGATSRVDGATSRTTAIALWSRVKKNTDFGTFSGDNEGELSGTPSSYVVVMATL